MVSALTSVVNTFADDPGYRPVHNLRVDTLLERIEWILRVRDIGQRELARRAKLHDERHLGVILSRLRKNPKAEIERPTLVAIARGGEVSVAWLADNQGAPEDAEQLPGSAPARPAPEYDKSTSTDAELDELIRSAQDRAKRERRTIHGFAWVELRRVLPVFSVGKVSVASAVEIAQAFSDDGIGKYTAPARAETGPQAARPSKASGE